MKRRILTISLVVAALVLLVTVGFAGWVITQKAEDDATGNFTAYSASTTGALTVKAGSLSGNTFTESAQTIVFGYAGSTSNANPWLTYASMSPASLVTYIEVAYSKDSAYSSGGGTNETFAVTHSFIKNSATYTVDSQLIGGPVISRVEGASDSCATYSDGTITFSGNGHIVLQIEYKFGTVLSDNSYANPYTYFNSKTRNGTDTSAASYTQHSDFNTTAGATWAVFAANALNALDEEVSDLSFKVLVSQN